MTAEQLADLAHRVASEARRAQREAFDKGWSHFAKCKRCGAPCTPHLDLSRYKCVCGGELGIAGYTPATPARARTDDSVCPGCLGANYQCGC